MAALANTTLINDANLVSYYKLEDTSDSKGANTLTNNASVVFNPAKFANGADMGSANTTKYLSVAGNLGISGTAMSIALWIKLSAEIASSSWYFASQVSNTSDVGNFIRYDYNAGVQQVAFQRLRAGISADEVVKTITLGTSLFHLIVYSYDGTTVRGYVDNNAAVTIASAGNGSTPQTDELQIGTRTASGFTSGIFDDVSVFSRALTAAEVLTLYTDSASHFMTTNSKFW